MDDVFSIHHEPDVMIDRSTQLQFQELPVNGCKYRQDYVEQICKEMEKQRLKKRGPYYAYCKLKVHLENM